MATISKTAFYFKQVAEVIGEEAAEIELQRVIDSGCLFTATCDSDDLWCAFTFSRTPHGLAFWAEIADRYESIY